MRLERITVSRDFTGKFNGTIKYSNNYGSECSIPLNEEVSHKVLALLADEIGAQIRQSAQEALHEYEDSLKLIHDAQQ